MSCQIQTKLYEAKDKLYTQLLTHYYQRETVSINGLYIETYHLLDFAVGIHLLLHIFFLNHAECFTEGQIVMTVKIIRPQIQPKFGVSFHSVCSFANSIDMSNCVQS